MRGHGFQQAVPSSTPSSTYFPTGRRVRPSALSIASFIAASYEAEARRPHDISLTGAANTQNSNLPNSDEAFDREAFWRPDTQGIPSNFLTGAANTQNSNLLNGGEAFDRESFWRPEAWGIPSSYLSRSATELPSMFHSENGYQPP
uniref:Uncharacterized protein n=1 Tax=Arundo donax TaxID=35708 RepID=A0A0A9G3B0_ARUDO